MGRADNPACCPRSPHPPTLQPSLLPPHIDHFGKGLAIVRSDVGGNIDRLDRAFQSDRTAFQTLTSIPAAELARVSSPSDLDGKSDAKGLLWLVRAQLFVAALLRGLTADRSASVATAARSAYGAHLKPYHGRLTSTAFSVALAFAPGRTSFFDAVGGGGEESVMRDLGPWLDTWESVLADVLAWLDVHGLNDPCKV